MAIIFLRLSWSLEQITSEGCLQRAAVSLFPRYSAEVINHKKIVNSLRLSSHYPPRFYKKDSLPRQNADSVLM